MFPSNLDPLCNGCSTQRVVGQVSVTEAAATEVATGEEDDIAPSLHTDHTFCRLECLYWRSRGSTFLTWQCRSCGSKFIHLCGRGAGVCGFTIFYAAEFSSQLLVHFLIFIDTGFDFLPDIFTGDTKLRYKLLGRKALRRRQMLPQLGHCPPWIEAL